MEENKKENTKYVDALKEMYADLDMNYKLTENDKYTAFTFFTRTDNISTLRINEIISEDGSYRIYSILAHSIKDSKRDAVIKKLNDLNGKYKYLNLYLDSDNDIIADYSGILLGESKHVAGLIFTIFYILVDIMDECIPPIMKVLWVDDNDEQSVKVKTDLFDFDDLEGDEEE